VEELDGQSASIPALEHTKGRRGYSGAGKTKSFIYPVMLFVLSDFLWNIGDAEWFFLLHNNNES
jgi:hypothetical protein